MIVDFYEYKKTQLKNCINCAFTDPEKTFGFPMCINPMSENANQIVTDKNVCPYFKRREKH